MDHKSISTSLFSNLPTVPLRGTGVGRARGRRFAALAVALLTVAAVAHSEFRLSDPTSEVYYRFAAVAGVFLQVEKDVGIVGDLRSNGDVQLKKDSVVDGDVTASGALVDSRGTVLGTVTEAAAALGLPEILDAAALRELADRVFEDDELILTDEVIDDVVFVAGTVHLRGTIGGTGTLIAGGDVRVDTTGNGGGGGGNGGGNGKAGTLDETMQLSLIALNDIRVGKDRALRGALRAGHDVMLEMNVDFEGVVIADNLVHVKQGSRVTFVDFDEVAPTVEIVEPVDGSFVTIATPRIELAFADDFSGVRAADTVFTLDGDDRTADAEVRVEGLVFTPAEALAEGGHAVEAVIFDHSDNEGRGTFSFIVDTVAPALGITTPTASPIFNTVPPITLAYGDATSGVALSSLAVAVDGVDVTAGCAADAASATCAAPADLAEGSHTITASLSDQAGNAASASFTFELVFDTEGPEITVLSPADGAILAEESVEVTGTVTDKTSVVSVTVNGQAATLTGDVFSVVVALEPGPNALAVEAVDILGNVGVASLSVTVAASDIMPPTLTLLAPVDGIFLAESQPEIAVSFSDDDSGVDTGTLAFTANGAPIAVVCNVDAVEASCFPESPLPDAAVDLVASISDQAGNTATAGVRFIVDTVGVEISIDDPLDGLVTRQDEVTVAGTVGAEVTGVRVNDVDVSVSSGSFSATVPLREGTNMLVALATKSNGNTGTASIEVTRDIQAPIVRIDSPRDGLVAVADTITVTGLVNDVVGDTNPRVLVNGFEATVGNGAFMLLDLELVRGPNVIEAVATDAVGNEDRDTITINFQPPVGARLLLGSGNGQFEVVNETLTDPLTVVVEDDLGNPVAGRVVRFEVSRNSGTLRPRAGVAPERVVQVPTDGSGRAEMFFTLGDTAGEGNNRVRATALGVAGEVEFCASALAAAPDKILMVEGDNQRGLVGHPLARPLEALVVDADGNPLVGVAVTFQVRRGTGTLDGEASRVRTTGADGLARAVLTLGQDAGINNNGVIATFAGHGGLPASFTASGLPPGDPAATRLAGVVLDNAQVPIPGALVTIEGTQLSAVTDDQGQFEIAAVPVGRIELDIDPTGSPRPETFPPLFFETVTVAGQRNTVGQPILLPFVDTQSSKIVGGAADVTLTMVGVDGLTLTVFAGSATFPDGSKTGQLSISQVHLDKVPMPPPSGTIFMPPAWTIQPAGVLFDPPARITIPNDGLPPGRVIDIFQFDHTLNEFINAGRGEVSGDGFLITSMPGFGVTRSGWGGCGQPQPPPTCASSCDDSNSCTDDRCEDGSCFHDTKPEGSSCDDMDFCTENDTCTGSGCSGEPKMPRQLASIQVGVDLAKVLGPVNRFNERLGGPCKVALAFSLSAGRTEECCSEKMQDVINIVGSGGGTVGVACEFPTPWSIPLGPVKAGIFVNVSLTANAQLSVTKNNCTDMLDWSGGGSVNLNFGVTGKIKAGKAVDVKVSGMGGAGCPLRVVNNQIECRLAHAGLVVTAEAELFNGTISVALNKVLIQPGGDYPVTLPLPFVN